MMMSDNKVGGWVKKGQNHDDVILECPLKQINQEGTQTKPNSKHSQTNWEAWMCQHHFLITVGH